MIRMQFDRCIAFPTVLSARDTSSKGRGGTPSTEATGSVMGKPSEASLSHGVIHRFNEGM